MYTKGKWEIDKQIDGDGHECFEIGNQIRTIATVNTACGLLPIKEAEANAKLIAAAPALLDALENLVKHPDCLTCQMKAEAAIKLVEKGD